MNGPRFHHRLPWIALAAVLGFLSLVGDAGAASSRGGSRGCCVTTRACGGCCCDPVADSTRTEPVARPLARPTPEGRLTTPDRPCECRSGEPSAPASRNESRPFEDRPDREQDGAAVSAVPTAPAVAAFRPVLPTVSPPGPPLLLRTSRLLF